MVIAIHDYTRVISVVNESFQSIQCELKNPENIIKSLLQIAAKFSSELLVWCHKDLVKDLKVSELHHICHHKHILATFNTSKTYYLSDKIHYLERFICFNLNKKKTYGTYVMSGQVGAIWAETILLFKQKLKDNRPLNFHLNGLAKQYQIEGLFCYSEPRLLKDDYMIIEEPLIANNDFFVFVKEHYKWVWVWFVLLCVALFEKRILLFSFLKAQFYKQKSTSINLTTVDLQSSKLKIDDISVDVIIPTIGRKDYLIDVLKDLSKQTILPKQVIIVEQSADKTTESELDYLYNQNWPFKITHHFTHTLGVCNARNIALKSVTSEWVFLADDDIRFKSNLFEDAFKTVEKFGVKALNFSCLLKQQKQTYFKSGQTFIFGSGSSFVNSKVINNLYFDKAFEFGFGEDTDFGARIRQQGYDVLYTPHIKLQHLKAPIGGFRQPIKKLWENGPIKPKPSPTMLALYLKHFTPNQLKGYKLFLFIKMYGKANPFKFTKHLKSFKNAWNVSLFYAKQLNANSNA